ncbi:hypothetical protein PV327_002232 [Microctonus hyperodae]|uniref:AAA+ ATPase domain-containing protein n=1 Tax=Microctonus hyperodae TaxID=165561 RepID=A0AA39KNW4_MICHY|nr:hypothetical protein PV327_002232 [Microctonus hyperodae]
MDENEFPDEDEEYDLIPTDIYKSLKNNAGKEQVFEQNSTNKSQEITLSSKPIENIPLLNGNSANSDNEFPNTIEELELLEADTNRIQNDNVDNTTSGTEKNKKRTFDELFGDIKDLLDEDILNENFNNNKGGKRPRWDEPQKIIERIQHERKKIREKYEMETDNNSTKISQKKCSISSRVPTWNFVAVTRSTDSQRLYVKVRPENKFNAKKLNLTSGFLCSNYSQLKDDAEKIILEKVKRASLPVVADNTKRKKIDDELWVDKYRPKSYMDLLSDETINRDFLRWMKLWDKVVFHRELKPRKRPQPANPSFNKRKFGSKQTNYSMFNSKKLPINNVDFETVDSRGFPLHRIALISGPPGLGKTTLAHIIAKHAGYNVVDINASDDRGTEAFRQALLASTQMKSMMGADPRPNCLILDEIDGAPAASIDLLLKFVQGKLQRKGKKAKDTSGKNSEYCKRPIVCICNEAYTPSLRQLRAVAYMINLSKVSVTNLTDRLQNIAQRENIRVSQSTLLRLAERSGCDIRVCLSALQYMGKDSENIEAGLGTKDTRKGLFKSWQELLQIPMKRNGPLSIRERVRIIYDSAHTDNSERLAVGVFENYPPNCHDKMDQVSSALEWFQFYDKITTTVMTKNDWRVMPYTNYAFVSWHLGFAGPKNPKLTFPQASIEAHQKLTKNMAIVSSAQKACGRDAQTIILDIAPCLFELLNPRLRAVAINLYSTTERNELNRLINVMLDLGLSFIQEKNEDGSMNYNIDPNLFEIAIFPECKTRRGLFYTTKQMVSQELEIERLKRAAIATGIRTENSINDKAKEDNRLSTVAEKNLQSNRANSIIANHVPFQDRPTHDFFQKFKLPPKQEKKECEKIITSSEKTKSLLNEHGVWYKYKEGYSNAIRRKVKMSDLL